ncbi:MAG: hypothetical protein ACRC6K_02860 [Fusobacteriaceae bacterium]
MKKLDELLKLIESKYKQLGLGEKFEGIEIFFLKEKYYTTFFGIEGQGKTIDIALEDLERSLESYLND